MEKRYFADFGDTADSPVIEIKEPRMDRQLFWGERMLIAKNVLQAGVTVPCHSHPHEQISAVMSDQCEVILFLPEGPLEKHCGPGELAWIPGNVGHEVRISPEADCEIWDLFSPVREDFIPQD